MGKIHMHQATSDVMGVEI